MVRQSANSSKCSSCAIYGCVVLCPNFASEARLVSDPFLSSEQYAEQGHNLYSESRYDEARRVLQDGLAVCGVAEHPGLLA